MTTVNLIKGINVPVSLHPLPNDCGLDVWMSNDIENWISKTLNAELYTLVITDAGKVCALVIALREYFPYLKFASGYPYSSLLGDVEIFWKNFSMIAFELKNNGVTRVELALTGLQSNVVLEKGAEKHIKKKYINSLSASRHIVSLSKYHDSNEYFNTLNGKLRWSVRKGKKNGITIKKVDATSIDIVQKLYLETMNDISAPTNYSADRFKVIAEDLASKNLGNIYLATCDSVPVSMAAVIDSSTVRHLIQIATPKKYRSSRVSDYLIWYLLDEAMKIRKTKFDFMASSKNDKTLVEYKQKWNCSKEEIVHAVIPLFPLRSRLIDLARYLNQTTLHKLVYARK